MTHRLAGMRLPVPAWSQANPSAMDYALVGVNHYHKGLGNFGQ